jgi:general secretion pathway protein A
MKLVINRPTQVQETLPIFASQRRVIPTIKEEGRRSLLRVDLLEAYRDFFKFKDSPFLISPSPRFFYFSRSHAEALYHLRYGIYEGLGFTMITGEPGTGKTMLFRYFLSKAGDDLKIVRLTDPRLSPKELLITILESLGITKLWEEQISERMLLDQVYEVISEVYQQSKRVVILLDEAQGLNFTSLEGLRLLSNLETDNHKLIQIVFFGQTELEDALKEKRLRQLDQRILVRYHLLPLQPDEISPYIQHQLDLAEPASPVTFTAEAYLKIYEISKGLPRLINALCERALMAAFIVGTHHVGLENVLEGWESLNGIRTLQKRVF